MGKCVENVTKFLECRRGLRDTQEINTNTYEKSVKYVTILLQSWPEETLKK